MAKSTKTEIKFWRAHCKLIETHTQPSHFVAIDAFSTTDGLPPLSLLHCTPPVLVLVTA